MTFRYRRPTLDDVPAILELVHACDIASVGEPDYTADEVREALTEPHTDMSRDCWVALDAGERIIGWSYPHNATGGNRDFVDVYAWPETGLPVMRPLLAMMMERMAERAVELGHKPYEVRAGAVPTETAYIEALTEAGFTFLKQHARMQMPLAGVSPEVPEPPAGVTVRPLRPDDEADMRAFHGVIEQAFRDTDHLSVDYPTWRAQLANESEIVWAEWFVAEVDDTVVGALQSSGGDDGNDEGWVKRLAVLKAYRKRGVGEALLRRAFATYVSRGRVKAGLGVDMENPTEAMRLYLSVGMTPLYRADVYRTEIG